MSAITHITFAAGGTQYRVKSGDSILIDRLPSEVGETVKMDKILLVEHDDGNITIGDATAGFSVTATVSERLRGEKVRIFKMRRRKKSRRTNGHRQDLTRLTIGDIKSA